MKRGREEGRKVEREGRRSKHRQIDLNEPHKRTEPERAKERMRLFELKTAMNKRQYQKI